MELKVLGCHGGETPNHRTTAFLLDERLAIDAGALTSQLMLPDQDKLDGVLVSHAHLDHVRDLSTIADNRSQRGCGPLKVIATRPTIEHLKRHFFNDVLWPNFATIPTRDQPTIEYVEIPVDKTTDVLGYRVTPIEVHHTIESVGFIIDDGSGAIGFSGDTGPTSRFWDALNAHDQVKALLMEVSFPNGEAGLATVSGHHTPQTLRQDLQKYRTPQDLPTMLYHIKPQFQAEVEKECAKLKHVNLHVLKLTDQFIL